MLLQSYVRRTRLSPEKNLHMSGNRNEKMNGKSSTS